MKNQFSEDTRTNLLAIQELVRSFDFSEMLSDVNAVAGELINNLLDERDPKDRDPRMSLPLDQFLDMIDQANSEEHVVKLQEMFEQCLQNRKRMRENIEQGLIILNVIADMMNVDIDSIPNKARKALPSDEYCYAGRLAYAENVMEHTDLKYNAKMRIGELALEKYKAEPAGM